MLYGIAPYPIGYCNQAMDTDNRAPPWMGRDHRIPATQPLMAPPLPCTGMHTTTQPFLLNPVHSSGHELPTPHAAAAVPQLNPAIAVAAAVARRLAQPTQLLLLFSLTAAAAAVAIAAYTQPLAPHLLKSSGKVAGVKVVAASSSRLTNSTSAAYLRMRGRMTAQGPLKIHGASTNSTWATLQHDKGHTGWEHGWA